MMDFELLKDSKGLRLKQIEENSDGSRKEVVSKYMSSEEVELVLWDGLKINQLAINRQRKSFESMLKIGLDSALKMKNILKGLKGLSDFGGYEISKILGELKGEWSFNIEGKGKVKEVSGKLNVDGYVVESSGGSKRKGKIVWAGIEGVDIEGFFKKGELVELRMGEDVLDGKSVYTLEGVLKDNRRVVVFSR